MWQVERESLPHCFGRFELRACKPSPSKSRTPVPHHVHVQGDPGSYAFKSGSKWARGGLVGAGNALRICDASAIHPIPDPLRTKRSYEFTIFGEQAFGAAYAAHACEETAAAKRRDSLSGRVDAAGRSVRLLTRTSLIYDRSLRSGEASAPATASDAAGKQAHVAGTSAC